MAAQQRYTPVPGMGMSSPHTMSQVSRAESGGSAHQENLPLTGSRMQPSFDRAGSVDYEDEDRSTPDRFACSNSPNPMQFSRASSPPPSIPYRPLDLSLRDRPPLLAYDSQKYFSDHDVRSASFQKRSNGHFWTYWSLRKRLLVAGLCVGGVAVLAAIIGLLVRKVGRSKDHSSGASNTNATSSKPSDPSSFTKDPRLHQTFWGFAYTPNDAQPPWCGATQANVTRDIQILSQLTTRLRLYGANCNETALVLQAIQDTKVNMTIWPAIYVDSNETAYNVQLTAVQEALKNYGTDNIEGIIVGNEYILDTAGSSSITSSGYTAAVSNIVQKVASVKSTIQGMDLNKDLPIGTSDAGSILSQSLASGIHFFMANVHPDFGALPIQSAAAWTYQFFQDFDVGVAAKASNSPQTYIAETGWPTGSLNASDASDGAGSPQGDASIANLQTFLDTFICQAIANGTQYFYFEAFDEPWKAEYGGVEPFWGMFDSDRNLKQITMPSCS